MSKVVLIDSPSWTRDYLMKELEKSGHQVLASELVSDMTHEIKHNRPDLVVIDPLFALTSEHPDIFEIKKWNPETRVFAWLIRSVACSSTLIAKADAFFIKNLLSADIIRNILMQEATDQT